MDIWIAQLKVLLVRLPALQLPTVGTTFPAKLSGPSRFSPGVVHSFPSLQLLVLCLLLWAADTWNPTKHTHTVCISNIAKRPEVVFDRFEMTGSKWWQTAVQSNGKTEDDITEPSHQECTAMTSIQSKVPVWQNTQTVPINRQKYDGTTTNTIPTSQPES